MPNKDRCVAGETAGRLSGAVDAIAAPPDFPLSVAIHRQRYRNWAGEIAVDDVWTCVPRTAADVVAVANWARLRGFRLRARGAMHNFSPLTMTGQRSDAARVILVDTTRHLTQVQITSDSRAAVRVGAGASMESLLAYLESHGYGLGAVPASGELTVGGVLAVGAHGTGIPVAGEHRSLGSSYGTLSNLVVALTAIVWDEAGREYVARSFHRSHQDCAAFLVHLGRAFVTEVTLLVCPNQQLRCVSDVTTSARTLFAAPEGASSRSFAAIADRCGRVEAVWFPFTSRAWTKSWTVQPTRPAMSRSTATPYNYPFSDNISEPVNDLVSRIVTGAPELTPVLGALQYARTVQGLAATSSADLWGRSKDLLLYVKSSTLRYSTNGYAILASRANIQRVVSEFAAFYQRLLHAYQRRDLYPINGPLEIRVTALDNPGGTGLVGARAPSLSAAAPHPDHPEWDVAIWLNLLTLPGSPHASDFYREVEQFVFLNFRPPDAQARAEWSKGWGYSRDGAWSDPGVLTSTVPGTFRTTWQWARAKLAIYDPCRVFGNEFTDQLFHDPA